MPSDPWSSFEHDAPNSRRLEADDIVTRGTDNRGHSTQIRVALPPEVASAIGALVASKLYPEYRLSADVLRDALYHRLQELDDRMPGWVPHTHSMLTLARLVAQDERDAADDAMLERFASQIERYGRRRELTLLQGVLADVEEHRAAADGWLHDELSKLVDKVHEHIRLIKATRNGAT